jgi:hypothetical protein
METQMTIEHIRRGIEYDAIKAVRALKKHDDNVSSYDVGECAKDHFDKLAYICENEPSDEILTEVKAMAQKIIDTAQEMAEGEKYYIVRDQVESEVNDCVAAFERELLSKSSGPKI